jgi:glycosyltransferase involved in cell wall biosynthesis
VKPLIAVSIIIPVYHAQAYLAECIASACNQTLTDIEIICVDDGSVDQSLSILNSLVAADSRIRVYRQPNSGAGAARNLALSKASGEYISFLDADDLYASSSCLQELYDAAKRMEAAICGGFRQLLHPDGNITLHSLFRQDLARKPLGIKIAYANFQYDYHFHNFLFQRALLERNQITFPLHRRFQDPPFLVRTMVAAKEFAVIPTEVYLYRLSEHPIVWDAENVSGLIRGLTDNLNLSREANLPKLHALTIRRIELDFFDAINGQMDRTEIFDLCLATNAAVDVRMLKGRRAKNGNFLLLPLQMFERANNGTITRKCTLSLRPFPSSKKRFQIMRGFIQCIREHGIGYTIRRCMEHLNLPMNSVQQKRIRTQHNCRENVAKHNK